ncbi:hypothetical protein [Streptomyces sp. NPDC057623]|uniref:hypothetical protein n=1 Tax=Streptomyces sp. NPDC057623 TaxID=3346187 RepID=UPI00368C344A
MVCVDLRPELLPAPVPQARLRELSREIERIEDLLHGGEQATAVRRALEHGPEEDHYLLLFGTNVTHPSASDLILRPPAGLEGASAEEIVDAALAHRPVAL